MRHKHTLETDGKILNKCIKNNKKTDECIDKNTLSVALKNLLFKFETKIKDSETNLDYIEDKFNNLKTLLVKNTDEKLGGGNQDNPGNPDNTILDDENTIKEIKEQFTYLTKTPDFITKIKDFLEKNNMFKTVSTTDKNMNFEIKYIDNDMFVLNSESESDKLKKNYYFDIDYYDSQPKFQEFKTQLNQLKELKKEYQDLISIFESAIKEFKNKKTNLEKLINTYFKNSLSTKRETLNKFDDFIKNITKNVNNIKDIPKNLINFLEVKKSNIETSLIQKSFPSFLDKIEYEKLIIDPKHEQDLDEVNLLNTDPKKFEVIEIIDENSKTFTLEHISKKNNTNSIIFTYKMKNSENIKSNHKLVIKLKKLRETIYKIIKIEAEIDNNIKISDEKRGGAKEGADEGDGAGAGTGDQVKKEEVNQQINQQVDQKTKESPEIKGLNGVFNNLQKKIEYVIKQKIRDGVDVSGVKSKDIEKGDVGDDIIETLVLDYERKKQNVKSMDEKERIDREFLEKVNGLGLNLNEIFEVNLMDKFYFILYSLVLHIITYSIIESLIMSSNLNSLVSIMGIYSFLYVLLIILTLGIIHIYGYRGKVFLNYLNLDHNFYNIIGHFIIVAIFFSIILILSQYINTANIENEDERVKMLYRIEIITGVMFTFTTMFILIL